MIKYLGKHIRKKFIFVIFELHRFNYILQNSDDFLVELAMN